MERKTVIRLLLLFGIGIPILIEAVTLAGLFTHHFGGGGTDGGTDTVLTTAQPTPNGTTPSATNASRVGVGEELLPSTPQSERLGTVSITERDGRRTLTLAVTVSNPTKSAYKLTIESVGLKKGRAIDGVLSTGWIPAGDSDSVANQWQIPEGREPRTVTLRYRTNGESPRTATVSIDPSSQV